KKRLSTTRNKVSCDCKKCDGKIVDPRTRKKYEEERLQLESFCMHSNQLFEMEDSLIEKGSSYPIKEGSSSSNIDPYNENVEEVVPLTKYDLYISGENKKDHNINKRRRVDHYQKSNKEIIDQHEILSDYFSEEGSVDEEMTSEDDSYMPNEDDLIVP
ncbi:14123_t:CDS:2, partial [Funneliformis caledonium]